MYCRRFWIAPNSARTWETFWIAVSIWEIETVEPDQEKMAESTL